MGSAEGWWKKKNGWCDYEDTSSSECCDDLWERFNVTVIFKKGPEEDLRNCWTASTHFLKKKKCLYVSKQRKNKEMVSRRIYLQQTRPVVSNSNCPAMLTCLARKKSFLFGSAFIRSFYIGSVFQGSTQYEGSDLSVLIPKTVKRVPVPLCSQKGAHSLILRV